MAASKLEVSRTWAYLTKAAIMCEFEVLVCMVGYLVGFRIPPGAMQTKNRRPYIRWAVGASNWRVIVTRTRESHPRLTFASMAPWRLLRQVAVSDLTDSS